MKWYIVATSTVHLSGVEEKTECTKLGLVHVLRYTINTIRYILNAGGRVGAIFSYFCAIFLTEKESFVVIPWCAVTDSHSGTNGTPLILERRGVVSYKSRISCTIPCK